MEMPDSRKRPLDGDTDTGATKRSNQGVDTSEVYTASTESPEDGSLIADQVHLKVLVPSIAAGAIIGKGGETITQIQKETGAVIKMSKANDYYPGTTERVCLITGTLDSVKSVHAFIMEKIREKPDPNPKPVDGDLKIKILVPNSTAGMIIGKGGIFIRQIKDESGAYVQISQKSKDMNLPERCVTIAGDTDQNRHAVDMVLQKIMEDPQSSSCPNISYADYKGPVASSNPTGSPYANIPMNSGNFMGGPHSGGPVGNIGNSMNNLHLNTGGQGNNGPSNPALENLKATLRGSGYSEQAVEEISAAMYTLANYGFLGLGLGLGLGMGSGGGGAGGGNNGGLGLGGLGNQGPGGNNLNLANLAGILGGGPPNGGSLLGNGASGGPDNNPSVFGPVGSTTTTMAGGDTGEGSSAYYSSTGGMGGDRYSSGGDTVFGGPYNSPSGSFGSPPNSYGGTNQNSFGLGTNMGGFSNMGPEEGVDSATPTKKEMEVGEHIVGAVLGPGGKGIVELQKYSGANIQISKKGVYAPGTRNRVVTITGTPPALQRAQFLIQQRITQEESKRSRQGTNNNR